MAKEIDLALGRQAEELRAAQRKVDFLTQVRACARVLVWVGLARAHQEASTRPAPASGLL